MHSRDSQESSPIPQFKSINSSVLSFLYSPTLTSIHDYWKKTIALTTRTFVGKVMSLLFNMLSRLVIAFLPRSKCLNFMAAFTICSDFGGKSMQFSRPEYWSGLPFPSPGDLPNPGIKPRSRALQADSLPVESPGKPSVGRLE